MNYGQRPGDVYRDTGTPSMSYYTSPQPQQYQYQHQQQYQQASSYGYDEGGSSHSQRGQGMPRGYHDDSRGESNMAGFAARKFAIKKQEETRKRDEYERKKRQDELNWKRAEEAYNSEQQTKQQQQQQQVEEELRRKADEEERRERGERRWADADKSPRGMQYLKEEVGSYQQEQVERQREQERWQQRSRAMASSSSPLIRSNEKPLPEITNTPRRPTLREMRSQSKSSLGSNLAHQSSFKHTGSTSNGQMSASPSMASSNHSAYSGLIKESSNDYGNTLDEDAEEDLTIQPDGFGGMIKVQKRAPTPPPRESALMLAKCADCGQRFPLDKLDGHSCISSSVFSQSAPVTPMDEHPPEINRSASSRSPFMEKYAQLVENRSSPILCDTKLKAVAATRTPLRSPAHHESPDGNGLKDGLTCLAEQFRSEEERQRNERIRQIQEQRAAKTMQSRSPAVAPIPSKSTFSPSLHNRDPASISSTASSRISSLFGGSSSNAPRMDDLTPSSSVESVDVIRYDDRRDKAVKKHIPKKSMDLGGIENLLQDIHTDTQDTYHRAERTGLGISTGMATSKSHQGRPSAAELKIRLQVNKKPINKTCSHCHKTFSKGQAMAEKDDQIYCIDDYAELFLEKCGKCQEPVRDVGVRSQDEALNGIYHRDCFSCFRCHSQFQDGSFYIYENAPYCFKHYHYLNGTNCHSCKEGIEGKCRQMETGERFHPRCLTCQYDNGKEFCKDVLTDYYLIKGKRLCEWHYEKVQRYLEQKNGSGTGTGTKPKASYKRRTIMRNVEAKKGRA